MPDEQLHAERAFSGGLGRRAAFGCCADCGATLPDITLLVCRRCRRRWVDGRPQAEDPRFLARESGHRERVLDLSRGVKDGSMTLEKAEVIYRKKLKAKEAKAA